MKKILFAMMLATAFVFAGCSDDDNDGTVISKTQMPQVAQTFIDTHFSALTINRIEKEKDGYDVYFVNGSRVEFDLSGNWDDVDCGKNAVPQSILALIPAGIQTYVAANYANQTIVEINKETYGYEIGLSNNVDLEFDSNGNFIKID